MLPVTSSHLEGAATALVARLKAAAGAPFDRLVPLAIRSAPSPSYVRGQLALVRLANGRHAPMALEHYRHVSIELSDSSRPDVLESFADRTADVLIEGMRLVARRHETEVTRFLIAPQSRRHHWLRRATIVVHTDAATGISARAATGITGAETRVLTLDVLFGFDPLPLGVTPTR